MHAFDTLDICVPEVLSCTCVSVINDVLLEAGELPLQILVAETL